MKNDDRPWFAPVAACLLILTATRVASGCPPSPAGNAESAPPPAAGVSGSLSPEQSAALARQRLRRCQLHPGTCEQGKGPASESAHGEGKNAGDAPDLKGVQRD